MWYFVKVTIAIVAIGSALHCGLGKASDRQLRQLEARCACQCHIAGQEDAAVFEAWLGELGSGRGRVTAAWGGGYWICDRAPGVVDRN